MTRHNVEISYALETKGPLHVGTGHGAAGLNRAMLRDRHGLPYIPGSTIKGRARYAAARICDWMGFDLCKEAVVLDREEVPLQRCASQPFPNGPNGKLDLPSRIFGCAWHRCTLRFSDARAKPPLQLDVNPTKLRALRERAHGQREVRTGIARSRILGTVTQGHLYRSEVAPPGLIFRGTIRGYLDCVIEQPGDQPVEILILWLALHLLVEDGVGGKKSSGSGKLAWATADGLTMMLDGNPVTPKLDDTSVTMQLLKEEAGAKRAGGEA